MPPFTTAMATIRKSLLAALKSFLRGKSFLQALFAFWISPQKIKDQHVDTRKLSPFQTLDEFLREVEERLLGPVAGDNLRIFSTDLKTQFRERLQTHPECMLPSFNHLLPTGKELGQYLALDVGGSTLRVALVELRGRETFGRENEIVRLNSFKITPEIKQLKGLAFFDWMASRIKEVLDKDGVSDTTKKPIPVGLAWSFPVDQVSLGGGLLMGMGKGFLATEGLLGQDLGDVIKFACSKQGLNVQLESIINDSSATLLSQAYTHAETRFGLILGTGTNIAVHLPVSAIGRAKFGARPESWFDSASHVIVNTELGMFGHDILPLTRWDELLNASHPRPDFQPLEHMLSGYYLGEICRLAIVEAVECTGLLGGKLPPSLVNPYSLDTEILSRMEADTSSSLEVATTVFTSAHKCPVPATHADIAAICKIAWCISQRSAALLAACVFSLWELRYEATAEDVIEEKTSAIMDDISTAPHTKVAFNGSVIEHYPGYLGHCQNHIQTLVSGATNPILASGSIDLVPAIESSIIGAAVALGCAVAEA